MSRWLFAVVAATLAVFLAPAPPASAQTMGKHWDRLHINALRAQHHEGPVVYKATLQNEAQRWAEREAAAGFIRQNVNVAPCWSVTTATQFGDNVAVAPSVPDAQLALEQSPRHRAIMLDPGFHFLGIGVARANGWVYMDQVYCG